ncbi:MAG: hypothetical protein M1561_01580 [Gammaproteobacteria bacterium]|nr:hypothetical protein [Gammaproteobacteria bacterium]
MCKNICNKIIGIVVIIVAITLAIVVSIWHQEGLAYIIFISRFFDVMLPVLAVGALLKYLICGCGCHCHNDTCKKE